MEDLNFINNDEHVVDNPGKQGDNLKENIEDVDIMFEPKEIPNIIKVIGVGGGGSNAVNYMFKQGIQGVDFVVCNTDAQSLKASPVPHKVKLGNRKLGAGSKPQVGQQSAIESVEEIKKALEGETKMLFITAGMGGGTGTGAAPVIAEIAKKLGILTVGIVSIPFEWEGAKRVKIAEMGIEELKKHVDTLIVISNSKLRELYGNLSLREAFSKADDILKTAAKGIAEIITVPGYVNVDFEDVKTVMTENESGKAIMSSAQAEGENRAIEAVEEALSSPLLDDNDIKGASDILLHIITGTKELTMDEIEEITEYIQSKATVDGVNANLIWGNATDESLGEALSVTIIATGFNNKKRNKLDDSKEGKTVHNLDGEVEVKKESEIVVNKVEKAGEEPKSENKKEVIDEPVLIKKEPQEPVKNEPFVKPETNVLDEVMPNQPVKDGGNKVVHDLFSEAVPETEVKNETKDAEPDNFDEVFIKKETKPLTKPEQVYETKTQKSEPVEVKDAEGRRAKLRGLSSMGGYNLSDFEHTPAYVRKSVDLDDSVPSKDENVSKYSLGVDSNKNPVINKGNSFLNKDVD